MLRATKQDFQVSSSRLLDNTFHRHSERSEVRFSIARFLCDESLFDQNVKKREIPHFADSVRNDEFEVFQQPARVPSQKFIVFFFRRPGLQPRRKACTMNRALAPEDSELFHPIPGT